MTSITTEEAETLAGSIRGASEMERAEAANALRTLAAERDAAIARAEKAEAERDFLKARCDQISGASSGTLEVLEQWKARALTAEAEAERLIAAFRVNALRWNPELSHAEINAEIERILNQGQI